MLDTMIFDDKPPSAATRHQPRRPVLSSDVILRRPVGRIDVDAASCGLVSTQAVAQGSSQKPNILFIMGDDICWMQPRIYGS